MSKNTILRVEFLNMSKEEKIQYIVEHGDLKVLTTYTKGGWDDVQMQAHHLGCTVSRGLDPDLRAAGLFNEYYQFQLKK